MREARSSKTVSLTALPEGAIPLGVMASALACRETMRLLRRMLARLPWAQVPYAERQRLAHTVRNLESDLNLALLILESDAKSKTSQTHRANTATIVNWSKK